MTKRDTLLIAHGSLNCAMRRELAARGLRLRESLGWHDADSSEPERILGAYTWFYEGLRHPFTTWRMRKFLGHWGIPLFVWNQDAPHYLNRAAWRLDLLDRCRLFDIYATHSLVDSERQFASSLLYLPNAADTDHYHLYGATMKALRNPDRYLYDVSFIGAMNGNRYKEMKARQEFFAALGDRLSSKKISFLFREPSSLTEAEQVQLIQASRISLNYGAACDYGHPAPAGLPERCYGVPSSGGFILCDKRKHAQDDFTLGENWAEFDGLDDCLEKIDYWLKHFTAARDLAERAHTHVMACHTYGRRAETLHHALLDWHAGKRGRLA